MISISEWTRASTAAARRQTMTLHPRTTMLNRSTTRFLAKMEAVAGEERSALKAHSNDSLNQPINKSIILQAFRYRADNELKGFQAHNDVIYKPGDHVFVEATPNEPYIVGSITSFKMVGPLSSIQFTMRGDCERIYAPLEFIRLSHICSYSPFFLPLILLSNSSLLCFYVCLRAALHPPSSARFSYIISSSTSATNKYVNRNHSSAVVISVHSSK